MQGFLGSDGLPPAELLAAGREEVAGYGGRLLAGTVTSIGPVPRPVEGDHPAFEVTSRTARPCAPGGSWSPPGSATRSRTSPGVRERWGRDLLHCPYCHGYEVRDQPLGVLGGTPRPSPTPTWSGSGPATSCSSPTAPPLDDDQREQLDRSRHRRRRGSRRPPGHRRRRADRRRAGRRARSSDGPRCSSVPGSSRTTAC